MVFGKERHTEKRVSFGTPSANWMLRRLPALGALLALLGVAVDAFSPAGAFAPAGLRLRQHNGPAASRQERRPWVGLRMSEETKSAGEEGAEEAPAPVARRGPAKFDGSTDWKMALSLFPVPTEGVLSPAEVQVQCKLQFQEDEGFEPPQGRIVVMDKDNNFIGDAMSFWTLGEDPSKEGFDKAGFWIWGLFEEPQYPFITFNIEVKKEIQLSEGSIPAGNIYGQAKITRSKDKGVTLSDGILTCRKPYKIAVDLLGLSDGILEEIQPCGTFTLTPQ